MKHRRPPGGPDSGGRPGRARPGRLSARLSRTKLRTRVLVGVLTVTLIALAGFSYVMVTVLYGYLLAQTDNGLRAVLAQSKPLLVTASAPRPGTQANPSAGPAPGGPVHPVIPPGLVQYNVELVTGQRPPREVLQGSTDLIPQLPGDLSTLAARRGIQTVTSSNGHTQLRLLAAGYRDGAVIVTTSLEDLNGTSRRLSVMVTLGTLAAALLIFTGVGLVTRRALRPVETMADEADQITAGDFTSRVSPQDPATEIGRLGAALNGMLARIQAAVREREASEQATRQFFADASHELRTPLAALRANAELYQQGALPGRAQVGEAMDRIAAEAVRMGNLVDDMLRLARLDQHPRQRQAPVDLSALAAECAERARIASPERSCHARITLGLTTYGDEEMLRRAIDNLLANVAVHTPPGTAATITAAAAGDGTVVMEVSDDGPGVPPAQLPRIFDRFYRVPAGAHRPGSGLGLAIVAATAAAHHGTVEAVPGHPRGLRVILTLPAAPQSGTAPQAPGSRARPAPQQRA